MIRGWRLGLALGAVAWAVAGCGGRPDDGTLVQVRPPQGATRPAATPPAVTVGRQTSTVVSSAPQPMPEVKSVKVEAGDTVYALSRRYDVPVRAIIDTNRLTPPFALQRGQTIQLPAQRYYTVKPGETLYGVSRQFGIDSYSLARANNLSPPYGLVIGQRLMIPAAAGSTPTRVASTSATQAAPAPTRAQVAGAPATPAAAPLAPAPSASSPSSEPAPAVAAPEPAAPAAPETEAPPSTTAATPAAAQPAAAQPAAEPPTPVAAVAPPALDPPPGGAGLVWPVHGRVLSGFGPTADGLHNDGINIAARKGEPVRAAGPGVVVYAGEGMKGYGNLILIRHPNGLVTAYAHNESLLVKRGANVQRGQVIARAGLSGGLSQPQLHFEIRKGVQAVDPLRYLPAPGTEVS